jgi:hypothetical protein
MSQKKTAVVEMDRRMLHRRKQVAEGRVRSSLSRLGVLLLMATVGGLVVWLFRSPLLAVNAIDVKGALPNMVEEVRLQSGIDLGQPLVTVRPADVAAKLSNDPRILTVDVELHWPNRVLVTVTPRLPVAWVTADQGWALVGIDGVVLDTAGEPGSGMPRVEMGSGEGSLLLGGLEFAASLDPLLFAGATVGLQAGELWAHVGGYQVRLGRPIDMAAKARTLNAILREPLMPGSVINLVAPSRPAVLAPVATETG